MDGLPDGYGFFETWSESGEPWHYLGEFKNGVPNGFGEIYWDKTSDRESGVYVSGILMDGMVHVNHSIDWMAAGKFGTGLQTTFTGTLYDGDGRLLFEGTVINGSLIEGTLYNADGSVYAEGTFGESFKNFIY